MRQSMPLGNPGRNERHSAAERRVRAATGKIQSHWIASHGNSTSPEKAATLVLGENRRVALRTSWRSPSPNE